MCALWVVNACFLTCGIKSIVILSTDPNFAAGNVAARKLLVAGKAIHAEGWFARLRPLEAHSGCTPSSAVTQVVTFSTSCFSEPANCRFACVPSILVPLTDPELAIGVTRAFLATFVIKFCLGFSCDQCLHYVCASHVLESRHTATRARLWYWNRIWNRSWRWANVVNVDGTYACTSTTSDNRGGRSNDSGAAPAGRRRWRWAAWPWRSRLMSPKLSRAGIIPRCAYTTAMVPVIRKAIVDSLVPTGRSPLCAVFRNSPKHWAWGLCRRAPLDCRLQCCEALEIPTCKVRDNTHDTTFMADFEAQ
mmetsp:Transcript_17896/g.33199  ORF Transcript_17896/g.33199 Transcript_17896/m.33199 type:complete len:305 (-) Transcript_17896:499-1413(-)